MVIFFKNCEENTKWFTMSGMIQAIAFLILAIVTFGCATSYQSQNFFGNGYSDIKTNPDSFIVNFKGNAYSHYDKVLKYALKRAAHLTLKNGFKYFRIITTNEHSKYTSTDAVFSKEPALSIHIKCSKEPTHDPSEINAEYYLASNFPK